MFNFRHWHHYFHYYNTDVDVVFETYHFWIRKEEVKEERRNLWKYENLDIYNLYQSFL
jgi:hypothetical protein